MDSLSVCLLVSALMSLQPTEASDVSATGPSAEEGPLVQLVHRAHRRERRCSCENQKDKECVFFCHIGIVWVNTPSRVVPSGLGSVRPRREIQRCVCTDTRDITCSTFCSVHTHTGDEELKRITGAFWVNRRPLKQRTAEGVDAPL